ncbi:MAG: p-hydroxycinnamoyl CoA hydratase/lyase [Armatimonadota bacterium]|nr:p-hydroxycinnamoyl CoA hydratase/lyase [Armatimonadota bacterium]MDR7448520.1 p-hydroxycinnamoyl CoA hydratase/lyase [Armatimonadota bacterium]MDR7459080.1 p-hydroxycinnamoyl CoA hydratase/lyase [Armatimonadota bacterium]MDR7479396.1 p-hydroxycinnamoyl CoA hydratase/lyase [Armatimonadota bacterium]MDR7487438.1 p-hydroxycinnamoyl CoA hydratase/lyase [Armatimonadota bacterium]
MEGRYETILVRDDDGIVTVTFNRPEKKNAMNPTLHREMHAALTALAADDRVRVLVITGAGDAFSAGMDLKEYFYDLKDRPREVDRNRVISQEWRDRKLRLFPAPTIAMVNGYCFGGALPVVAACDLALAAEEALFGLSEVNFKGIPAGPVAMAMGRVLHPRDALWHMLLGEPFDGRRAAELKLVNRAVPRAQLAAETYAVAAALRAKDPHALRLTKELFRHSLGMDPDAALAFANAKVRELTYLQQGGWIEEGIGAFLAGRSRPGLGAEGVASDPDAIPSSTTDRPGRHDVPPPPGGR